MCIKWANGMLNTIHLQTFLAVVETGSYSAAAERLHLSQPAVSSHIRALEAQLDQVRLFRRVGQQMLPTQAGEELIAMAREMLELATQAEERIRSLRGQLSGRVAIGCTPSGAEVLLTGILHAFRERHPAVCLSVNVASVDIVLEQLSRQHIHIAFIEEKQSSRHWVVQLLGSDPLVLIAPRDHELAHRGLILPDALRQVPIIMPRSGSATRRVIDEGLQAGGLALETDSATVALEAVCSGIGLAFVPQSCALRQTNVSTIPVELSLYQEWFALRSREHAMSRAVQEAFAFLTGDDVRAILHRVGVRSPLESKALGKAPKMERKR
ncbi:MAG: LysR family transcriptional regulator [Roseiflexus castenholzii]|nr:MAG: LysR family transcriptional regulator [Roseiflexus castenholzii]